MGASLTLPRMEIAPSAVHEPTRQHAEEATLAALVELYATTLYRVAFSVLRNTADAEDAVQSACIKVLRCWAKVGGFTTAAQQRACGPGQPPQGGGSYGGSQQPPPDGEV